MLKKCIPAAVFLLAVAVLIVGCSDEEFANSLRRPPPAGTPIRLPETAPGQAAIYVPAPDPDMVVATPPVGAPASGYVYGGTGTVTFAPPTAVQSAPTVYGTYGAAAQAQPSVYASGGGVVYGDTSYTVMDPNTGSVYGTYGGRPGAHPQHAPGTPPPAPTYYGSTAAATYPSTTTTYPATTTTYPATTTSYPSATTYTQQGTTTTTTTTYAAAPTVPPVGSYITPGSSVAGYMVPAAPQPTVDSGGMFQLPNENGQMVSVKLPAALFFLTSWCHYCKDVMPEVKRLSGLAKYRGWSIYGIVVKEGQTEARSIMNQFQPNFPLLVDSAGSISSRYSVSGYPTFIMLDKGGNVIYKGHNVPPALQQ